jgi:serine/threonine-protein kinase RsbT
MEFPSEIGVRDADGTASDARTPIRSDADIVTARVKGRALAFAIGFSPGDATLIATAISELTRNVVQYAESGEVTVRAVSNGTRRGIRIEVADCGPGITDVDRALEDGYSTAGRLGLGLPGVRRLMDDIEIDSLPGRGTVVCVTKWMR